jgi:phospholipid/cholesterol/gamma-HCH transport system substrate-binding protein
MLVPRHYLDQIPEDSKAAITASNLLGDKYVDISKGTSPRHVKDGGEIGSQLTQDIPEILAQASGWLTQFQGILVRVDALLATAEHGQGTAGRLFNDTSLERMFSDTDREVSQIEEATKTGNGAIAHLSDLSDAVNKTTQRLNDIVAEVNKKEPYYAQISDEGKAAMADATADLDEAKKMLDDLNAGRGAAGQLLKGDEIDKRLTEIRTKIDAAVGKMNSGEGTIGQLMINPKLTDALAAASNEFHAATKAFAAHPKKFMTIRVTLF